MKAIISSTYDDRYLYFLPIVTWCWNKLGVDVICFMPSSKTIKLAPNSYGVRDYIFADNKVNLIQRTTKEMNLKLYVFDAPEHKEATYAQCSRLYGACLNLREDEVLITSDVDMAVFKVPAYGGTGMGVVGIDLVPKNQIPICYIYGDVKEWRNRFEINSRTYQQCLDDLLGNIEADHFRGNYWGKDQEEAYNKILGNNGYATLIPRAREGTQFASKRYDRDDAYILDRLNPDTIDYHMNRPGYEPQNFEIILKILQYHYPNDNFDWLISYNEQYKALL